MEYQPAQPDLFTETAEVLKARWWELVEYDEANPAGTEEEFEHRCGVFNRLAAKLAEAKE